MFIVDTTLEFYIALVAVIGTAAGVWIVRVFGNKKVDHEALILTSREQQVLQLLSQGLSNAEIADRLSLSLSTVKREVSGLFVKMDVKNRTQAQEKANRLKITGGTLV